MPLVDETTDEWMVFELTKMRGSLSFGFVLAMVLTAVAPSTTAAASGELAPAGDLTSSAQVGESIEITVAPMTPLCELLTEESTNYILENELELCGYNQASQKGGATTLGYSNGLCGSSALFLYNGNSSGQARISYGFSSTAGAVVVRSNHRHRPDSCHLPAKVW